MTTIEDLLLDNPSVQQLIQNLRRLGIDSYLAIRGEYLTLTIRLLDMHPSDMDAKENASLESEALLRKKKFMQSLLRTRRHVVNTDFLSPEPDG